MERKPSESSSDIAVLRIQSCMPTENEKVGDVVRAIDGSASTINGNSHTSFVVKKVHQQEVQDAILALKIPGLDQKMRWEDRL